MIMATQHHHTTRARNLRKTPNAAEQSLWSVLKGRALDGHKFTRQMPIGPYFADFVCRSSNVVIELDGSQHLTRAAYDRARDEYMLAAGYSVFRVPSAAVLHHREDVCATILAVLEGRIEDFVETHDLRFQRSYAKPMPRGFASRYAQRRGS
jgi:very-short-patch-repair endonuclease